LTPHQPIPHNTLVTETDDNPASVRPITPEPKQKVPYRRQKQTTLNAKQTRFVEEYLKHQNGTKAAIDAGYSQRSAGIIAVRLKEHPLIRVRLQTELEAISNANKLSPGRILEEWRRIALADVRGLYDEQGNLKPIHSLTAEQAAAIQSIDVVKRNVTSGDGSVDTVARIRLVDRAKALEALSKHLGLLEDRVEHSGTLVIRHELYTGQQDTPKSLPSSPVIDVSVVDSHTDAQPDSKSKA
jgi:phage terminase small subunit